MGRDAAHSLPFRDEGGAALPSACGLRHLPRIWGAGGEWVAFAPSHGGREGLWFIPTLPMTSAYALRLPTTLPGYPGLFQHSCN